MNVAYLLQGSPSEDHRRQRERDRERERDERARDDDRDRDRDKEWDRRDRERPPDLPRDTPYPPRLPPPPSSHFQHPSDPKPLMPAPAHPMSHKPPFENEHRPRDLQPQPPYVGPPPFVHSRHPSRPPQPPPSSVGLPPLSASPPRHLHSDYSSDFHAPRDIQNRSLKEPAMLSKPLHLSPPYVYQNGPASEPSRSLPLSRPRSPSFGDYSERNTPSTMASHASVHAKGPPHRDIHIQQIPPLAPYPPPHLSPPSRSQQSLQPPLPPHPSTRRGPGHGHEALLSPAMGSLPPRPFDEAQYVSRGPLGAATSSSTFMPMPVGPAVPSDKAREKERMWDRESEREAYARDREKAAMDADRDRRKRQLPSPNPVPLQPSQRALPDRSQHTPATGPNGPNGGRSSIESERDIHRRDADMATRQTLHRHHHLHPHRHTQHTGPSSHVHPPHQHGPPHQHPIHRSHSREHHKHAHVSRASNDAGVLNLAPPGVSIPLHPSATVNNTKIEQVAPPVLRPHSPPQHLQPAPGMPPQSQLQPSQTSRMKQFPSKPQHPPPFTGPSNGPSSREMFPQPYLHPPQHPGSQLGPMQHAPHPRSASSPPPSRLHQHQHQSQFAYHAQQMPPPPLSPKPALEPLYLGTFVYPETPFPYFFPSAKATVDRETRVRILIPTAFLPRTPPSSGKARIWGGGIRVGPRHPNRRNDMWKQQELEMERMGARRVYTDDSDILLCAIHSGKISWGGVRRARTTRRDLSVELIIRREQRYFGGPGVDVADRKKMGVNDDAVDTGLSDVEFDTDGVSDTEASVLQSASWGNGHDGSGVEVANAQWIPRGTAHALGLKNRKQRLREYTYRRRLIVGDDSSRLEWKRSVTKRQRSILASSSLLPSHPPTFVDFCEDDPQLKISRETTFVLGNGDISGPRSSGFKFTGSVVQDLLFSDRGSSAQDSSAQELLRRKKRRKIDHPLVPDSTTMDLDTDEPADVQSVPQDMILENGKERFLVKCAPHPPAADLPGEDDKEGSGGTVKDSGRRYNIYLVVCTSTDPLKDTSDETLSPPAEAAITDLTSKGTPATQVLPDSTVSAKTTSSTKFMAAERLQLLHQNLGAEDIQFRDDGLAVISNSLSNVESSDKDMAWFICVKTWHWCS